MKNTLNICFATSIDLLAKIGIILQIKVYLRVLVKEINLFPLNPPNKVIRYGRIEQYSTIEVYLNAVKSLFSDMYILRAKSAKK